jgi:hypothetical protein
VSEAARILQAALAGARDAAIRANGVRGVRLLPDPVLNVLPTFDSNLNIVTPGVLTYSRIIPIEPAPDYNQGRVQIVGDLADTNYASKVFYTLYSSAPGGLSYVYPPGLNPPGQYTGKVIRLEESAYHVVQTLTNGRFTVPNQPTSWWWNVRVGDKVRVGDSGRYYTVVGPITKNPYNTSPPQNSELFVNNEDAQGNTVKIQRTYAYYQGLNAVQTVLANVEFLYLVNGQDDDGDGYVDNGWDGLDNDFANGRDDAAQRTTIFNGSQFTHFGEWETEVWVGTLSKYNSSKAGVGYLAGFDPDPNLPLGQVGYNAAGAFTDLPYSILRRPVVSPGAREVTLPGAVVIDATTWNSTLERSRLPIDRNNYTVDILVDQAGQVVSTNGYSSPSNYTLTNNFYHFWLSDRSDVFEPLNLQTYFSYPTLPVTPDGLTRLQNFAANNPNVALSPIVLTQSLKKDRALVTLFAKSGQIVTTSVENFIPVDQKGNVSLDRNLPYRDAQLGIRESK